MMMTVIQGISVGALVLISLLMSYTRGTLDTTRQCQQDVESWRKVDAVNRDTITRLQDIVAKQEEVINVYKRMAERSTLR